MFLSVDGLQGSARRLGKSCESIISATSAITPATEFLQTRRQALLPSEATRAGHEIHEKQARQQSASYGLAEDENVIILARNKTSGQGKTNRAYNLAFTSRALHTFMDMQKACDAARKFYNNDGSGSEKNQRVVRKLIEWSHRAKQIEMARHVTRALSRSETYYTNDSLQKYTNTTFCNELYGVGWESLPPKEQKRISAVWELFQTEVSFFYKRLLVLKDVFKDPLKSCQVEGYLINIEPGLLFGNLDELCEVSYSFCCEFEALITTSKNENHFCSTDIVLKIFQMFANHDSPVVRYQAYCINYKSILEYLETIRKMDDRFIAFEKACTKDLRCQKLHLQDLIIAPLHRITKLPLLLKQIHKYSAIEGEQQQLETIIGSLEESLRSIDASIQWLRNFERLQELQGQLIWPPILEMDSKSFIPEFMKAVLNKQFCEKLLAHPRRELIHEEFLTLTEWQKKVEVYAFLFNDMLMLTKPKKSFRRSTSQRSRPADRFTVIHQPVPLDCCVFCDVTAEDAIANGLKNAFMIMHLSRFCQVIAVHTLQATSAESKRSIDRYESIQPKDSLRQTSSVFAGSNASNASKSQLNSAQSSPVTTTSSNEQRFTGQSTLQPTDVPSAYSGYSRSVSEMDLTKKLFDTEI